MPIPKSKVLELTNELQPEILFVGTDQEKYVKHLEA